MSVIGYVRYSNSSAGTYNEFYVSFMVADEPIGARATDIHVFLLLLLWQFLFVVAVFVSAPSSSMVIVLICAHCVPRRGGIIIPRGDAGHEPVSRPTRLVHWSAARVNDRLEDGG